MNQAYRGRRFKTPEITNEYVEYKNAYNLREEVENFIVNARKEVSRYR